MSTDPNRATMVALLARWQHAFHERRQHEAVQKAAEAKAKVCNDIISQCRATCKVLGFERDDKEQWARVMDLYETEAAALYNSTRDPSYPMWELDEPLLLELKPMPTNGDAASAAEPALEEAEKGERPPIKQIAIDRLKAVGADGSKAADIRDYIQRTYNTVIHEKTVGMTLYRLLKDGKVRRDKHTWFIAQEAMNPGAGTPGSEASQTKTGKEE